MAMEVKWEMGEEQKSWLNVADNVEKWEDGKLKASNRRILLTHQYPRALNGTHAKVSAIWRYHEKTRSIVTANGSRRPLLKRNKELRNWSNLSKTVRQDAVIDAK